MQEWNIGLSPWILADGNYPGLQRGQVAEFALEFYEQSSETIHPREKSVELIKDCHYRAVAEVVFHSPKVWVLDFGICAFSQSKVPPMAKLGDFVEIEFYLGIDPFFYFEQLYKCPGILPLIYTWRVNTITVQSAPLVSKSNAAGQSWKGPDESNYSYRETENTRGKRFDTEQEAMEHYRSTWQSLILGCTRLEAPARFQRGKLLEENCDPLK